MTMNDKVFGVVNFSYGWNKEGSIALWGNNYDILVTATAYYEHESITDKQREAYSTFLAGKTSVSKKIETLLANSMKEPEKHLRPRFLVFEKDGAYALMLDDDNDPDDGIAVQLHPVEKVMSQDAYL